MRWGTKVGDCTGSRLVLLFDLTLRDAEGAKGSLRLRSGLDCCAVTLIYLLHSEHWGMCRQLWYILLGFHFT